MIRINFHSEEMSFECLICSSPCPLDNPTQGGTLEFDSSGLLDKELETIFLLRKVLLVPASLCQQFARERGHPSEWGLAERLCPLCRRVLAESHFVFNRMQKLAKEYETLSGNLRAKAEGASAYLQNGIHHQGREEDTVAHKVQWHLISRNFNNNNYKNGVVPIIKQERGSKVIKNIFPKPASNNKAKPWSKVKRKPPKPSINNASAATAASSTPAPSNSNSAAAKTARAIAIAKARANANLARKNGTQLPTTSNINEVSNPEIVSVKSVGAEGGDCNDDGLMPNIKVEAVLDETADNGQWFHFPTLELQPPKKRRGRPPGLGYKPPKLKKMIKKKKKKGVSKVALKFQKPKKSETSAQAKSFIMQRRFTFEPQPWEEGPNYSCEICSNTFTHPKTLEVHTACHNNKNLLPCPLCEAKCSRHIDFDMHVKGHETNENSFVCYVCFKPFRWKKDNIRHIRKKHQLEKTYRCLYCTIRLKTNDELEEHISQNHRNRRNYACKYCSKRFSQKRYLQNHLSGVHGLKASDDPDANIECDVMEESGSGVEMECDDPLGDLGEVDISDVEWDENEIENDNEMEGYQNPEQGELQEGQQDVEEEEEEEEIEENILGYNFSMSVAEEPEFDHEEPEEPQYEHEEPEFVNGEPEPALI